MDLEAFGTSGAGRLTPITGYDPRFAETYEHVAFVPAPLPSTLDTLTAEAYTAVIDASAAVARLDQAVSVLPNPRLLNRPAIRREAQSTSALEGTYVAFTDVLEADFLGERELTEDVREVYNSVQAAEYLFQNLEEGRGLTLGLLHELQKMLVRGTRADNDEAGHVRTTQVFIGVNRRRVTEARFVPPPPGAMLDDGVNAWLDWVLGVSGASVMKAAVAHYQFETLHPFNDGNGRLGRLIAIAQLVMAGDLRQPVLNLSPWLQERREEYQDHLLAVSCTGDFSPWVVFFSRAVQHQALGQVSRIQRLQDWKAEAVATVNAAGLRGVIQQITEDLIGYPFTTPTFAAQLYGRTYQACNEAIKRLVGLGILEERTKRRYGRIFAAPALLRIIED